MRNDGLVACGLPLVTFGFSVPMIFLFGFYFYSSYSPSRADGELVHPEQNIN